MQHRLRSVAGAAHRYSIRERRPRIAQAVRPVVPGRLARLGPDRVVALSAAAIVLGASVLSLAPGQSARAVGGTTGDAQPPRLAVGGDFGLDRSGIVYGEPADESPAPVNALSRLAPLDVARGGGAVRGAEAAGRESQASTIDGPFLEDGTLLKPVAVDTSVADARGMLRSYRVKAGDTLVAIARRFDVSTMTIWWANKLTSKDLTIGRLLTVPPVSGLVVTVGTSDTLQSVASRYKVDADNILSVNRLEDPNLVIGQVLVVPGAIGRPASMPKPKPVARPKPRPVAHRPQNTGSGGAPRTYGGGSFAWPVAGGTISQYYHYGHYGIDIQAPMGTPVRASAGGKVIFAGWKSNGGGYQVWIAHGSNLYTTYNHMSAITVGNGASVGRGAQVGRIGMTGNATGPHLHFEVWRGRVWDGGRRVNPLGYL